MTSVEDRLREAARSLEPPQSAIPPFRRVRQRARRRRLSAIAVVVALIAVASAAAATRKGTDHVLVANPGSTRPPATVAPTTVPIPFEAPLASTIGDGIERLDPPAPSDVPAVSATAALTPTDGAGNVIHTRAGHPGIQPVVRLARFTSASGLALSARRLVWAVIYNNVQLLPIHGGGPLGAETTAAPAPPQFGVAIIVVDAATGEALVEHDFGPPLTASQLR
jgi:hypothetical protein